MSAWPCRTHSLFGLPLPIQPSYKVAASCLHHPRPSSYYSDEIPELVYSLQHQQITNLFSSAWTELNHPCSFLCCEIPWKNSVPACLASTSCSFLPPTSESPLLPHISHTHPHTHSLFSPSLTTHQSLLFFLLLPPHTSHFALHSFHFLFLTAQYRSLNTLILSLQLHTNHHDALHFGHRYGCGCFCCGHRPPGHSRRFG